MGKLKEVQQIIDSMDIFEDKSLLSDGYHTFAELYEFRKMYNALIFNEWSKQGLYNVHKSIRHNDGTLCFGGGWFVVFANLPTGQITNHYRISDWDLFDIPERIKVTEPFDGHTAENVLLRIKHFNSNNKSYLRIVETLLESGWKKQDISKCITRDTYHLVYDDILEGYLLEFPKFNYKNENSYIYGDLSKTSLLFKGIISNAEQLSMLVRMLGIKNNFFNEN